MCSRTTQLVVSAILLLAGGYIYVAFRTEKLAMFNWFSFLHLDCIVNRIREVSSNINLPNFIKFCLPNGLWISSYILATDALVEKNRLFWVLCLPVIAILFEFLQIIHIIPGTFDMGDLICLLIPVLLYLLNHFTHNEKSF